MPDEEKPGDARPELRYDPERHDCIIHGNENSLHRNPAGEWFLVEHHRFWCGRPISSEAVCAGHGPEYLPHPRYRVVKTVKPLTDAEMIRWVAENCLPPELQDRLH